MLPLDDEFENVMKSPRGHRLGPSLHEREREKFSCQEKFFSCVKIFERPEDVLLVWSVWDILIVRGIEALSLAVLMNSEQL